MARKLSIGDEAVARLVLTFDLSGPADNEADD